MSMVSKDFCPQYTQQGRHDKIDSRSSYEISEREDIMPGKIL